MFEIEIANGNDFIEWNKQENQVGVLLKNLGKYDFRLILFWIIGKIILSKPFLNNSIRIQSKFIHFS